MSDLKEILLAANIKRAVIVDDAYDDSPRADDLSLDPDTWAQFFDDLNEGDRLQIGGFYPDFNHRRADELSNDDIFVATLWNSKDQLRNEVITPLFQSYIARKNDDLAYLNVLLNALRNGGLECDTAGRDFGEKAAQVDLIVIDLYLGSSQDEQAIQTSIAGLKKVINQRRGRPPLVVLMSRSSRLQAKRSQFRDESGLFESAFRIISKAELGEVGKLNRVLVRLATHYPDSLRLASFLDCWQVGIRAACDRTANLIRTLDLTDHAQIQQLLLEAEGQPLGSYLVDVFDRVLQHEVERDSSIIDSAIALNALKDADYPPPYVAGSPDLQLLVYRSLFQNPERLRLKQAIESRVAFGDLLKRRAVQSSGPENPTDAKSPSENIHHRLSDIGTNDVLVVLTPACDLQRNGAKGILLLNGQILPLDAVNWSYAETPIRTPIIEFPDGKRFWVKWNLKHIETVSHAELNRLLDANDGFAIVARLRESHALELQQKLLSSLGRVGLLASMPATFQVKVEVYLPDLDRKLFRLTGDGLAEVSGVRFIGRSGDKDMRLVLCEDDCESIYRAISGIDLQAVHEHARSLVENLRTTRSLLIALEKGIVMPTLTQNNYKDIEVKLVDSGGNVIEQTIGLIRRGENIGGSQLSSGDVRKAGVVVAVSEPVSSQA